MADGFHVSSATYDRTLDDIFAIQDETAADVVKQLQITLLGNTPTTRKTAPEAYALYLQSIQLARQSARDGFEKSDALLRPPGEALGERLPDQMLHDQIRRAALGADVVQRADVRVGQRRYGVGLALEAHPKLRVGGHFGRETFRATVRSRRVSRAL